MGLIVDKPELLAALGQSDREIRARQEEARRAIRALDDLAGDGSLTGEAWTATKRHASHVVKTQVKQVIRQGDRIIEDNAVFRQRLNQLIEDDYLNEDGIADCIQRMRQANNLLRQAQDVLPGDDKTGLKSLLDRMWWQSEQQANRLEDKIQRLHALDQATRGLYRNIDRSDSVARIGIGSDPNAVMAKLVIGTVNRKQLSDFFEKRLHMSHEDAAALADFTIRYRKYAKDKKFNDKRSVYEYACILASVVYSSGIWQISGGMYGDAKLTSILRDMGYKDGSWQVKGTAEAFKTQMKIMHNSDGKSRDSVDFIHMMAALACMLNTGMGNTFYHVGGTTAGLNDNSGDVVSWAGDVATASGDIADWNADMDAINLEAYIRKHPGQDCRKAVQNYYVNLSKGDLERNRIRQFCGNYDPMAKGDFKRGLDYLRQNGLDIATQTPEAAYLGLAY
jgi:hypothetical protein